MHKILRLICFENFFACLLEVLRVPLLDCWCLTHYTANYEWKILADVATQEIYALWYLKGLRDGLSQIKFCKSTRIFSARIFKIFTIQCLTASFLRCLRQLY
jgi:hypothetical protein